MAEQRYGKTAKPYLFMFEHVDLFHLALVSITSEADFIPAEIENTSSILDRIVESRDLRKGEKKKRAGAKADL